MTTEVLEDELAVSLARALTAANRRARELGVDLGESLVDVSQQAVDDAFVWRISYGPRDYVGRRGSDLIVDVDPADASVKQTLRGQ